MEFFDNTCWKNEAANNKRATKRVIDIVARVLRNTRYGIRFLAENELPRVLRKSPAKNVIDTYESLEIRKISSSQNIFGWLLPKKIAKDVYSKNNNDKSRKLVIQ